MPGLMSGDWKRSTVSGRSACNEVRGQRRTYPPPRQPSTLFQRHLSSIDSSAAQAVESSSRDKNPSRVRESRVMQDRAASVR